MINRRRDIEWETQRSQTWLRKHDCVRCKLDLYTACRSGCPGTPQCDPVERARLRDVDQPLEPRNARERAILHLGRQAAYEDCARRAREKSVTVLHKQLSEEERVRNAARNSFGEELALEYEDCAKAAERGEVS